jgi:hypothetical protein
MNENHPDVKELESEVMMDKFKSNSSISQFQNEEKVLSHKKHEKRNSISKQMMRNFRSIGKTNSTLETHKMKLKNSNDIREIFKSEKLMSNNVKSLQKEKKTNDTIVALMSFFMIILCFYQVCELFNMSSTF